MPRTPETPPTPAPPESEIINDPSAPPPPAEFSLLLSWEAPEYLVQRKSALWYAAFGIILALLIFSAVITRSFLSGVVFVLIGTLILLYSERTPRVIRFSLTADALVIHERLYPYSTLDAFNIVDSPSGPLVLLRSRRLVMPLIHVPLGATDRESVRTELARHLREDRELHESLADLLAHRLGF